MNTSELKNLVRYSLPWWLRGKESTCNAGDAGWIPGWWRSPGEGSGRPLQYSCLETSMDGGAWGLQSPGLQLNNSKLSLKHMLNVTPALGYGERSGRSLSLVVSAVVSGKRMRGADYSLRTIINASFSRDMTSIPFQLCLHVGINACTQHVLVTAREGKMKKIIPCPKRAPTLKNKNIERVRTP